MFSKKFFADKKNIILDLFKRFNPLKKKDLSIEIEAEFNKGNIVLPTGKRDYEDYEEFKEKTIHLKGIQNSLKNIK